MMRKMVTLYIDDTSVRLLVIRGRQIKDWADLPLEPGLVKAAAVVDEARVIDRIKQILKEKKVRAKKVIVGFSGLHCLSRPAAFPRLPKPLLAEAVMREAKSVLPVPLEQLYLSWQTTHIIGDKTQVFLVATPRKTTDALLRMCHRAGLKPCLLDMKPLALARLVREATAIIVDVQPTEFDIIIMVNGIPQPVRTVPFPEGTLSWPEKLTMVKDELERTMKFYDSKNLEKPLDQSVPIYVSGELVREPERIQSLFRDLGHPVLTLPTPWNCPERLDAGRYMVNLALALKGISAEGKPEASLVNLNLLPLPYQPKQISWGRVLALPAIIALVGMLVPLVMLTQSSSVNVGAAQRQLDATNQFLHLKLLEQQKLTANITALGKELARVKASRDMFLEALSALDRRDDRINRDLEVVTGDLPQTISLTNINHSGEGVTLDGIALSEADVLAYARNLDRSGRFSETTVASIRVNQDSGTTFSLVLKIRG